MSKANELIHKLSDKNEANSSNDEAWKIMASLELKVIEITDGDWKKADNIYNDWKKVYNIIFEQISKLTNKFKDKDKARQILDVLIDKGHKALKRASLAIVNDKNL